MFFVFSILTVIFRFGHIANIEYDRIDTHFHSCGNFWILPG